MHSHLVLLCLSVCGLCSAFFLFHEVLNQRREDRISGISRKVKRQSHALLAPFTVAILSLEKGKPPIFCFKICPLYCPKHPKKRIDYDASSLTYLEDNPYITPEGSAKFDYFAPTWKSRTPKLITPTTQKPPYLDNPYIIDDGSGDYDHPPSFYELWKPKPTQKPSSTAAPETTTELIYLDHNPYLTEESEDYDYSSYYNEHWKPKLTKKTTTTTKAPTITTEKPIYFDHHPYFFEEWPDYEYDYPIRYHSWKPKLTTMPTTTEAPTTEEPTFICQVCEEKCGNKS